MVALSQPAGPETCSPTRPADTATRGSGRHGGRGDTGVFTSEVSPSLLSDSLTLMRTGWESPLLQLGQSGHPPPLLPPTQTGRSRCLKRRTPSLMLGAGETRSQTFHRHLGEETPHRWAVRVSHSFMSVRLRPGASPLVLPALLSLSEAARGAENSATLDSGNLLNG